MRSRLLAALLVITPGPALAQGPADRAADPPPAATGSASRSVGAADAGRLEDGVSLEETRGLRLRNGPGGRWGTAELVGLLQRAAARVQDESPGPPLLVGDLSSARGGRLRPHESHQSGRDADLSFFFTDEDGRPIAVEAMVRPTGEFGCGRAPEGPVCIDGRRTFLLIAAMVADPVARVQWILLHPTVREQLLASGRRMNADEALLELVRTVTAPRHGSEAHDDHMHVRIYCPVDDRPTCRDRAPFHALYEGEPPG